MSSKSKEQEPKYQHFWEKDDWQSVIPDSVLAHWDFRVQGYKSCDRKAKVQGVTVVVVAASVPVAAAAQAPRWAIALLGALASVAAAVGQLYGWREHAVRENRSIMQIQRELALWKNGQEPYRKPKKQPQPEWEGDNIMLSMAVEAIVQSEGEDWASWFERARRRENVVNQVPSGE